MAKPGFESRKQCQDLCVKNYDNLSDGKRERILQMKKLYAVSA